MSLEAKDDALEFIKSDVPKYLTPELKEDLYNSVKDNFPSSIDPNLVYRNLEDEEIYYQGDGVIDIPFSELNIENGSFDLAYISGVIISNTCDISIENKRLDVPKVQLAGVFTVYEYIQQLEKDEVNKDRITSFLKDLKSNRISNLFYLPEKKVEGKTVLEESFVRFDLNVTFTSKFLNGDKYNKNYSPVGDRIFSFSDYVFYIFLIKLSIHYCRLREGVFRSA